MRFGIIAAIFVLVFGLTACASLSKSTPPPMLPFAVSNQAVAVHHAQDSTQIYSFAGLKQAKTWDAVTAEAFTCDLGTSTCRVLPPLPDGVGRLAATAQAIGQTIYIFGGYAVAQDGTEVSTPEVWGFDIATETYARMVDMPVPVDDTVSAVFQDRYIYLISGWHKDNNVTDVQIYDTFKDEWASATPFPGKPVFGHAGGILGHTIAICDGVIIVPPSEAGKSRSFEGISACWRGDISADDLTKISWRQLPQLPGKGHYRMAATKWPERNAILFVGGSDNPYNINGIGYDEVPSEPSAHVWAYDVVADKYFVVKDAPYATMDHRGLLQTKENEFAVIGGMGEDQTVLQTIMMVRP